MALVLGLALDAAAASGGAETKSSDGDGKGDGKSSANGSGSGNGNGNAAESSSSSTSSAPLHLLHDGDNDKDDDENDGDNPYISQSSVRDALHLPQDPSAPPFSSVIKKRDASAGAGAGAPSSSSPPPAPPLSMAAKFVEQAVFGLQGWCVAALLNPSRSRRRHRRCLEDWVHVHQHALNAEGEGLFARWLESEDGWDWRLPASSSASASAEGKGDGGDGGDNSDDDGDNKNSTAAAAASAPRPPPRPAAAAAAPLSPTDAAIVDHASPLSCWVEEQACRGWRDHLLSGFALDLYAPHEAAPVLLVAEHLERRAEGAAGALAERYPFGRRRRRRRRRGSGIKEEEGEEDGEEDGEEAGKKASAKGGKPSPSPLPPLPPPPPPHSNDLAAEADSRAATIRRFVAGALLRAAAALMAESVAVAGPSSSKGSSSNSSSLPFSFWARVPPAPEPFNSARDRFAARFLSGPMARLTTPPRLAHGDYELAVGGVLAAVAEGNRARFGRRLGGAGGGKDENNNNKSNNIKSSGGGVTALHLLRLARDACLFARGVLPQLAAGGGGGGGGGQRRPARASPRSQQPLRAVSAEEEGALARVLGMTAVSLGVLEREEQQAEEELARRLGSSSSAAAAACPSPLVVSWDCSIHPLFPALRVMRRK